MTQKTNSILTPDMKAMVGKTGEKVDAWGVVDEEYLRRFAQAIPDWDPLYWDKDLAQKSKFKGLTVPPLLPTYIVTRRALSEKDQMDEVMVQDPMNDGGMNSGGGTRSQKGMLPRLPLPPHIKRHLHGGDDVEVHQYPRMGDKITFQRKYTSIQERIGGDGKPFLVARSETTYWNQKGEVLCKVGTIDIRR